MEIEIKYNIGDLVKFGPFMAIVTGLRLAGEPLNILYVINYFNNADAYVTEVVYDCELETEKTEFGFRAKKEETKTTSGEGGPDWEDY